jgi:lipopolysaccharide/colanic/teichoic acid biosynthesis glycosyltransferase
MLVGTDRLHLMVASVCFRFRECTWMSRSFEIRWIGFVISSEVRSMGVGARQMISGTKVKSSKSTNFLHRGLVVLQTRKYRPEQRIVRRSISSLQSFNKRTFDIVVAIAGLLILSPLILLISLGIRIESPGPVLCRHKRYSANNVEFEIFEFRTRLVDQREKTSEHRPEGIQYITRFGQILRRSGMNKLPQLISVLCGEMSIVGTHLFTNAPGKPSPSLDLHEVRPGLVTWAHADDDQCDIADTAKSIESIDCDRDYIENCSFFFDMNILLHTLLSKSTYL